MKYRSYDVKQALLWNQERRTKTERENHSEWLNIWRNISSMRRAVFHQQMKHRAKWGERGILRESRDGFKRKIKIKRLLPVHCYGSSHVHQMNVALQLVNRWRVALARFWHICLEQNDSDAVMFFWRCWWQSSSFTCKCPEIKGKQKKCPSVLLTALFKITRILKFKSQLTFGFFAAVNHFRYFSRAHKKHKFTSMGSKGHGLWFVIGGSRSVLCVSVFQGLLLVIIIMIEFARVFEKRRKRTDVLELLPTGFGKSLIY